MPAIRLQKVLSAAGVASRRAAETLIVQGRVSVNGQTVRQLGTRADPAADDIRVDGRHLKMPAALGYFLLNKPRGYVTTRSDPYGRATVVDLAERAGVRDYVYPVGRLDYDSEGLVVLTNDGELAARLTHPRHDIEREYEACVRGVPDDKACRRLEGGVALDGRRTAPARVRVVGTLESARGQQALLAITIREGRNRQVRRMCNAVGHPVVQLRRVRFGPIRDGRLRVGQVRRLSPREIAALGRAVGMVTGGAGRSRR